MSPPEISNPAPVGNTGSGAEIDRFDGQIYSPSSTENDPQQVYVDRYGHFHTEAILRHWSPGAVKSLGIRCIEPDSPEGGAA